MIVTFRSSNVHARSVVTSTVVESSNPAKIITGTVPSGPNVTVIDKVQGGIVLKAAGFVEVRYFVKMSNDVTYDIINTHSH